jgi:mRNA interferase HigB
VQIPFLNELSMRIIAIRTLREFWTGHADAEQPLKAWYKEAEESDWSEPADIKGRYPSADILSGNRVVFNIKGNTYRLIVKIHYNRKITYIRFVGTHAEYDKVDATTI